MPFALRSIEDDPVQWMAWSALCSPLLLLSCYLHPLPMPPTALRLKSLQLPDTTITAAEQTGPGVIPGGVMAGSSPGKQMPAFCRLTGILHPTADSVIRFEVWLPEAAAWNGRILNTGNGGFAGSIDYRQMGNNLQRGYATAGSDAGHQAEAEDASWAYRHPEKITDFGYRATHLTALRSKDVVKAFYGKPQSTAYFDACSDGGREALMEAQRFPEDYDGILAGAPANNWVHMLAAGISLAQDTTRDPSAYISSKKLPAINAASLLACDAQDGVKDGIVSDPAHCRFDPAVLLCKGADDVTCLTPPQVASLRAFYRGGRDAAGKSIFPGLLPGDENPIWHDWILGNAPNGSNYANGFFRYMVYNDPTWQALTANTSDALQAGRGACRQGRGRHRPGTCGPSRSMAASCSSTTAGTTRPFHRGTAWTTTARSRSRWARTRQNPPYGCTWCPAWSTA